MNTNDSKRVAYLVNQYPKVSHSFIRREILMLEALGVGVERLAVRGWDEPLVDAADVAEQQRTHYLLRRGALGLVPDVLHTLLTRPGRFLHALAGAWRLAGGSGRSRLYHLAYLAEACALHRQLQRRGVRHVHAHFGTNSAEVALLCARLGGVRYSFTVHGPEEFDRPEALGLATKVHEAAFVVAISQFGRSQIWRWTPSADWDKVQVVHCALEPGFFADTAALAPCANQRLVCVSRISAQKGQLVLIDALARLRQQGVPVELVLAGDGEMRPDAEARAAALGVADALHITGWLDGAGVQRELAGSRALVLPSFAEGLPVVIMEAMAQGRPVVTTLVAGIPELVRDGVDGWLVPAGDLDALVAALRACLAAAPDTLARMGAQARARVAERHDVRTEAAKLVRHFEAAGAW